MKQFIFKINQFLLERYPTIWNTKIVWMLAVSLVIHIVFYLLGFIALIDVTILHERGIVNIFFENGMLLFSILISIVLLVVWLVYLVKNNSFKNFYPTSRLKLFSQFSFYFIIILASTTFYFSYMLGLKSYINITYPYHEYEQEVKTANNSSLFLSHDLLDYTLKDKKYPTPFDTIYCETNDALLDDKASYVSLYDINFQFYTLSELTLNNNEALNRENNDGFVYSKSNDSTVTYYYKKDIVIIDSLNYSPTPSYYNYSNSFYDANIYNHRYNNSTNFYDTHYDYGNLIDGKIKRNKKNYNLLNRNNPEEIKALLDSFLRYCNKYKIEHNLTTETWFKLIYSPSFKVKNLIHNENPNDLSYNAYVEQTALEKYIASITTDRYIHSGDLYNVFENISDIKNKVIFNEATLIFIWLAYFLAALVFIFRISNLKLFILSVITSVLLIVFVSLTTVAYDFLNSSNSTGYFISHFTFIISTFILLVPILLQTKLNKTIVGICTNISVFGFPLYLFLIVAIIALYQSTYCDSLSSEAYLNCSNIITDIGFYWAYILLVLGFLFIYFYARVVKRWIALPEH